METNKRRKTTGENPVLKKNENMAHKKVLNKKQDFWEYKQTNRQRDFEVLKLAKEQEAGKRLVAVRIDTRTTKMIDVWKCTTKK